MSGGTASANIGVDIASSDVGALSESATNLKLLSDEVTHTGTLNTTNVSGAGSYSFTFTMPAGATAGSSHTLYAAARVDQEWNDDTNNFIVTAKHNQTITALFNGSSVPAAITYGTAGTLSMINDMGTGAETYSSSNTSVCSISGTTLTAVGVGSCTITGTKAADTSYNADSDTFSLTVNKASQGAITAQINAFSTDRTFTYLTTTTATLSNSQTAPVSTGAVTYSSSNTAVCTVTAGTTLNLVGAGTCTITVTRATDANYLVVSDTIGVTVNKANQSTLTALINGSGTNPTFVYAFPNGTAALSTSGGSGTGAVSYSSSNSVVCSISVSTLTLASAGTCTITATKAADTNYNLTADVIAVTVNSTAPTAPTGIGGSAGDQQVTVTFTAPTNNGGAPPLSYTATCTASGQTTRSNTGSSSPIVVGGGGTPMTNGVTYSCSVTATNFNMQTSVASGSVMLTPSATPVAPAITSANSTTFTALSAGSFQVTATGVPSTFTYSRTGTLPPSVTFSTVTGQFSGTPATGTVGAFVQMLTVSNGTLPNATQSFTLNVQKANQTITFGTLADRAMRPVPAAISATASSGLTVAFTISAATSGNCFLSGNNLFTSNVGTCTVLANQSGNATYNAASQVSRSFTISQGTQVIDFGAQGGQTYSPSGMFGLSPKAQSVDPIDLNTTTGLTVAYASLTPAVCSIAGITVTIVTAGTCTIEVTQAGDANYAAATPVSQDIVINMASQTISWGAQSNQVFGSGGTFAISPLASGGASGNAIVYGSSTPAVCTVVGTTVTKVTAGTCTLTANQAGNVNYTAAVEVSQALTITASAPTAPTATLITPSDSQVRIEFDPPASNGGSVITNYRATCNPGGIFTDGATSPIIVSGLANNTAYTCSVRAQNAAGAGTASNSVMATPFLETGANLWTNACSGCHVGNPAGARFNAAGQTGAVINYVRASQPSMQGNDAVQALTLNELAEIAKYIETFVPTISVNTAFNTGVGINVASHLTLGTVSFTDAVAATLPANGTLSAFTGTQVTYTPDVGFVGVNTFTYRGTGNAPMVNGEPRTVTITVAPPPAPVITSPAIASGVFNSPFGYQIAATNSPTSYGAAPLAMNTSVDTMTGLISGTPMTTGTFMVTVSATNAGGTGMQVVEVTIGPANQTIAFGVQGGQTFSPNGVFALNPVATASSGLAVAYSSLTSAVCSISGTTVTMLTAGNCGIAANQLGDANYNAALQVARVIVISATAPGAPTIGTATPGDAVGAIAFTPPANNGGSAITGYTATCTASGQTTRTGSASTSPISVGTMALPMVNGVPYSCTVFATNAVGNSIDSAAVNVTPTATPVPPAFTNSAATTFTILSAGAFNVTATGTPAPSISLTGGTLPMNVTFPGGTGSASLSGTPASGTVGTHMLTFTATNGSGSVMQSFVLTVQKASQSISFTGPASQPFTSSTIPLSASATSGLTVTFTSNTPSACTVSGTTLTLLTVGTCSITASQAGSANYNAATSVTQGFNVSQATQTITFLAQTTPSRNFVAGTTFPINPVATASSGLTASHSSTTTGICTVLGTTVTMVAPGTCILAANQSGSANYLPASQVTQNVSLNATAPGAPTIGAGTPGNGQATIAFTAPANNGGSAITGYIATCNAGGFTGNAMTSPVVVTGLTNSTQYTCSVAAINGVGTGASSATVNVTPLSGQGSTIWATVCDSCHTSVPGGNQLNGAGTTATVLNFVRANQPLMLANSNVQALTNADLIDLATYIAANLPVIAPTTAMNTPVNIDVNHHITLTGAAWSAFTSVETVTGPTNGMLGSFTGTQVTYTPNNGFVGTDTFTYRGKRGATHNGDPQTINITVNPPAPVINSSLTANGTFNTLFAYQIDATNSPTSFGATGLPAGLSVDIATGNIFGTPAAAGSFNVGLSATNAGGTGEATLMLTISPATQTITFGVQASPRTWSAGGSFAISPVATGGASGNAIVYSSLTIGVCTVSGATVSIITAGICTLAADQAGNANFAAATQVTRNVIINAIVPGAPTGLMASAGDTIASLTFTAPTSSGGAAITGYGASCTPSAPGSASASPINLTALTNSVQYTCTVRATNSAGTGSPSSSVMFTPNQTQVAPTFTSANNALVNVTEPLSFQASVSGTPAVFTFSSMGTLPAGVSFSAAGLFSGTPASGSAASYPLTLTVTNAAGSAMQSFTLTVSKLAQTVTFANPGAQTFSGSPIMLSPSATSGLTVTLTSNTLAVCTVSGLQVSFVATGQCNLTASQTGTADYLAATPVVQEFTVGVSSQTITFPVQSPISRSFSAGASFSINPPASASSGLSVTYSSTTTGVCTVSGQNVTMVAVGICTIAANQAGNANFTAASQVTRSVAINAVAASAPQNLSVVARDGRGVFSFNPPTSNGGSPITSYTVTCGGVTGNGSASPVTVNGLTNGVSTTCSVVANTAAGAGASASFMAFTPNVQAGSSYWTQICTQCHAATPTVPQTNAGGTTMTVLNYVIANQPLMSAESSVTSLTTAEKTAIVAYIASVTPAANETTAFNTGKVIDLSNQISVGTVAFETLEVVSGTTSGALSAFTGTSITYTPTSGFAGADSFTFRGKRTTPSAFVGDTRTVNITVQTPPAPVITSAASVNGTFGVIGTYQITATNSPVSYGATGLPGGCTINTGSGLVTCTPTATGVFMVTVSATNPGGTGMQTVTVTVAKASQTITFGAQGGQTYALNGSFAISPTASATSSLAVTYSSLTTGVCTVSGTTVTMVSGGTCTLAADQGGNANYNAALQVTQNVTVTATAPGAPTGLIATPGPLSASIAFAAPASNGGSPITGYSANCTPTASANAGSSPINLSMLTNGVTYTCTVSATNAIGSTASASVMVTPTGALSAPAFTSNTSVSFNVLAVSTFTGTASGNPAPALSISGTLPSGVSFTPATGVLGGTPATGTAGNYPLTFTAMNSQGTVMQSFTLTIAKLNQTIAFANPGAQTYTTGTIVLSGSASSGLTVSYATTSPTVCTVSGNLLTTVTTGVCSIAASQSGNADYNAASDVTRGFNINVASQTITFNTQVPASRSFLAASTFSINPIATASSGLTILYSSTTTAICTVAGTTVTMVAPGTCTIAANQGGNANYNAATQVTQSVSLNATAPGAPTIGIATGGNGQATIEFTAPNNNGGSAITGYLATCNVGGFTGNATTSPVVVTGLTNSTQYTCSVAAINAIGTGASSATVNVTPLSGQGAALWAAVCDTCHTSVPTGNQFNAAGSTATVLNFVRANQPLMLFSTAVQSLNPAELADIAAYIAANLPVNAPTTTQNVAVDIDVGQHVHLTNQSWSAFTSVEVVTGPTNGSLGSFNGTIVTYTPALGFLGTDTFTYRGKRGATYDGDPQTITITVSPPVPGISSTLAASGTFGVAFNYQIVASNTPTSYGASGLPAGLSVNTMNGAISGTPTVTGSFAVTLSASNAGGTGMATLMLTIDQATQIITFAAQTSPRNWSAGGSFTISPVATGGLSGNAIVHGSTTPTVCTVSGTSVSILTAGTCTLSANQSGNANYAAAVEVTRDVAINAISPTAPVIGSAVPGNGQATVSFSPPASNGGAPIETYTVTCGAQSATGPASPITVTGLTNGATVSCSVTASNALTPSGPASAAVMVTPVATQFGNLVFSRKLHNGVARDININHNTMPNGLVDIEPRIGGSAHTIHFVFTSAVSDPGNVVVTNVATGLPISGPVVAASGNDVVVTLTGVPEIARITITIFSVNGAVGATASLGLLPGDVTGTGRVTAADIAATKTQSGNAVGAGNFRSDINVSGTTINSTDVSAVKARSGQVLP